MVEPSGDVSTQVVTLLTAMVASAVTLGIATGLAHGIETLLEVLFGRQADLHFSQLFSAMEWIGTSLNYRAFDYQ